MNIWLQDLRLAFRMLRKNLVLTLVILASLGIGIGANTAIFSVVDALLLRPLPYPHPDRLAAVWLHSPGIGILRDWPSPGQYVDIQNQNHSFDQMAIAQSRTSTLTGREQPERVDVLSTQSSLLTMFGAQPLLGRTLLPEEDTPGRPGVAVLSYGAWQRLFNSDPAVVGRSITLNARSFTVVGVLQRSFLLSAEVMPSEGPMDKVDIFLPLAWDRMPHSDEATKTTTSLSASSPAFQCNRHRRISTSSPAAFARKISAMPVSAWMLSVCKTRLSETCGAPCWCCSGRYRLSC
jgi:hypothetical protein